VWTGTLGVLELPVNTSSRVELYLIHKEEKKYIPVPAYFWKVNLHFFPLKAYIKKAYFFKKGYFIIYPGRYIIIRFSRLKTREQNCLVLVLIPILPGVYRSGNIYSVFYISIVKPFSKFFGLKGQQ
jgi:hypothetical protein